MLPTGKALGPSLGLFVSHMDAARSHSQDAEYQYGCSQAPWGPFEGKGREVLPSEQ